MVSSAKCLAQGLGHFLAFKCFLYLLVFLDDNKLEYKQVCMEVKETRQVKQR